MLPHQVVTAPGGSKKYPNLPSTLFVNNIDPSINKVALSNLFCRYGTVLSVTLTKDNSANNKSYGFIVFAEVKQAELAQKKFQYYKLGNYELIVMFAADKPKLKQEGKIFIKNIPVQVKHIDLHKLFETISPNLIVHIAYDEKHKNSVVYGYAHYFNPQDAIKALNTLQNCELGGEKLELSPWLNKDDRHQAQPQEKKNLYVGNIPLGDKDTVEHAVKSLFENFGEIESILLLDKSQKVGFYSALIAYKNAEHAEKAYESLNKNPTGVLGSQEPLYINWHQTREERTKERQKEGNKDNLYLRNLKMSVTIQELRNLFGNYGEIKDIELKPWTASNGKTEAQFAFVSYKEPEDAEKALDNAPNAAPIQHLFLSKAKIYIRFFMPKNEREQEVKTVKKSQQAVQPVSQQQKRGAIKKQTSINTPVSMTTTTTSSKPLSYSQAPQISRPATTASTTSAISYSQPPQMAMYGSYPIHNPMATPMSSHSMHNMHPPMNNNKGAMYQPFQAGQPLNKNLPFEEPQYEKKSEKKEQSQRRSQAKPVEETKTRDNKQFNNNKNTTRKLPIAAAKLSRTTLVSKKSPVSKKREEEKEEKEEKIEIEQDEKIQMIIESREFDDAQKQAMLARMFENQQDKQYAKY